MSWHVVCCQPLQVKPACGPRGVACVAARFRAQALVEIGLVLPVVLILLLGLFDIGRALVFAVGVQFGAGEAARLAAAQYANPGLGVTNTRIYRRLIDASAPAMAGCSAGAGASMTCTDSAGETWSASITYSPSQASGNSVEVKVTAQVSLFAGLITGAGIGLGGIAVQGDAVTIVL